MRFTKRIFLALFMILLSSQASISRADKCYSKYSDFNICDFALKIQKEMAPKLPMQLSKNLHVKSMIANGPELMINALLAYDENFLNQSLAAQGAPRSVVDNHMKLSTINSICSNEQTEAFVGLGGSIIYRYYFIDGVHYLEIPVDIKDC